MSEEIGTQGKITFVSNSYRQNHFAFYLRHPRHYYQCQLTKKYTQLMSAKIGSSGTRIDSHMT